jgi:hypothetical protein
MNTPQNADAAATANQLEPNPGVSLGSPPEVPAAPPASADQPQKPDSSTSVLSVLCTVQGLTEDQQMELLACEAVISTGWSTFVQVGLALARIREGRLYQTGFDSFEAYCQAKWQYGRHYVNRLISAAQVFTHLVTICHQRKPEHESQVRPLIGLTKSSSQPRPQNRPSINRVRRKLSSGD